MPATAAPPDNGAPASIIRAPMALLAGIPLHPVRLSPPPLRTAAGHSDDERRASWLELFFDLVFAGAVGQLAGALQDHPSLYCCIFTIPFLSIKVLRTGQSVHSICRVFVF